MNQESTTEENYHKFSNLLLNSALFLRNEFKTRWKRETGKTWLDSESQGKEFIEGLGKETYGKAMKPQKVKLENGVIDDWDVSLLSCVLRNFGDSEIDSTANEGVKLLADLRNHFAHHLGKLTDEEFINRVQIFKKALKNLNVCDQEINSTILNAAKVFTEEVLKAANSLQDLCDENMKNSEFDQAVECCNEALTLPNLPENHKRILFEKRSACYLELANKEKQKDRASGDQYIEEARKDATAALSLDGKSWKAHHLLANYYQWNASFDKAIEHYEQALQISPDERANKIKAELDLCKVQAGIRKRRDNIDPRALPIGEQEIIDGMEAFTGEKNLSIETVVSRFASASKGIAKGQEHVYTAMRYLNGWNAEQNFEKAVKTFQKAAAEGNAEGIYNLGLLYLKKTRVPEDVSKAFDLFSQAANMSPNVPGLETSLGKNCGVANAQHALGSLYEEGIHVKPDYSQAKFWYEKGAENGMGSSANNLAIMYKLGNGMGKDLKQAEMYWKLGVYLKDQNAAAQLSKLYVNNLEPDWAKVLHEIAHSLGCVQFRANAREEFQQWVVEATAARAKTEKDLIEYEEEEGLSIKGLVFWQRLVRAEQSVSLEIIPPFSMQFSAYSAVNGFDLNFFGKINQTSFRMYSHILVTAETSGSTTAARVVKTDQARSSLCQALHRKKYLTKMEQKNVVNLLYEGATKDFGVESIPPKYCKKLEGILEELYDRIEFGSMKEFRKTEFGMKVRFCYAFLNLHYNQDYSICDGFKILKEGIELFPDNWRYYDLIMCFCWKRWDKEPALFYANKGLENCPRNIELLFNKASVLIVELIQKLTGKTCVAEAKTIFEEFVRLAPKDHPDVPSAYYSMAILEALREQEQHKSLKESYEKLKMLKFYRNLGNEAEKQMLPCYLPYESSTKAQVEEMLSKIPHNKSENEYLYSPLRKMFINRHRECIKDCSPASKSSYVTYSTIRVNLIQQVPEKLSKLKAITLVEMDPTRDHSYHNRVLYLTIIEDPNFYMPSIHLIVEDENGDVARVYVYNVNKTVDSTEMFEFGSKIAIMNPYVRIGKMDMSGGIRVDEPACIFNLGRIENMCRFCGEENAMLKCGRCKRANYCSRECQVPDYKIMKHKLICGNK
ncbi:unnamed protein product [Orchesella dallaii]|uniref:MYND-type domain-containing protein n=1 Tax=Orchesella dallaii TaxID=48710 RepID=A0ABP1RVI0_9HEXA